MIVVVLMLACVATQCEAGATQSAIVEVTAAGEELADQIAFETALLLARAQPCLPAAFVARVCRLLSRLTHH